MATQAAFTLTANEIYSTLANMIISQDFFDRISDSTELVDKARVDGGLYGDKKLYYSADVLSSSEWGNDSEAANLLALARPADPEVQAIVLDKFRQIRLTLDDYLSKRAFSDEGAFGQFNSLMEGMIGKTKRINDVTTYNAFVGTDQVASQTITITIPAAATAEEEAKIVAQEVSDLMVELTKVSRAYNEYGHVTKFSKDEIKMIWSSAFINKIKYLDLPAIFHKDELANVFTGDILPSSYFGTVGASKVAAASKVDGAIYRALEEQMIGTNHYFAGDELDESDDAPAGLHYVQDNTIACKIYVKLPPFMSAFEAGTTFFNPRSLTTNRYLTWGRNTLAHFKAYPCITVKVVKAVA